MTEQRDPTVGELSEGAILRRVLARTPAADAATLGPGDDAAVLRVRGELVATTDTLVHGPDFRLSWSSGYDLGWKAAAVNLADVAAMGATPTALLVALAMPNDTRISFLEELARGLAEACAELAPGCAVVGGDLTVSQTLTVAVTALGDLAGRPPVTRAGARVGDIVALAGVQGQAVRGLGLLFARAVDDEGVPRRLAPHELTDAEWALVDAQLRPHPPVWRGPIAASAGASAMMDVSDGLVLDARRMADASGVTIDLHAAAFGADAPFALSGGEDHALLATFPAGHALADGFRPIGSVIARRHEAVTVDGAPYTRPAGWDPYRDWDSGLG